MYKFIKIKGPDGKFTGYFVPNLYHLGLLKVVLKIFGFHYIIDRLNGWRYWWTDTETNYELAIKTLNELKKTRIFDYKVIN